MVEEAARFLHLKPGGFYIDGTLGDGGHAEALLDQFAALPRFSAKAVKFEMGYLARSHRCEIDSAGRVLLPPVLRQYAGLKRDAVFLGTHMRFRLMDRDSWVKVEGEHDAEAAENPAMYEDLGI